MGADRQDKGLDVRREVLGRKHVDRALEKTTEFNQPMQDLVNEYCWGEIWTREGLSRKTRSIINLAMLTALNRPEELKLHIRGALRNGCTKEEIQEVFLHSTIYCGVPAGMGSFRLATEVFNEK